MEIVLILGFSVIILFLLFINFSLISNKINVLAVYKIFIDIKRIRVFLIKIMVGIIIFLFINYNRYIYYRVGLRINYGYIFIYALFLVILLWVVWQVNRVFRFISHFLPRGIVGVLKLFIPILEIIGVLIRPLTLAIRLATNIRCGHVVLLMFRFFVFNIANYLVLIITVLLFGLYFIEFLVCIIQAYVF
jgi:F0F1-type ATP synthase membrane subunit a